MQNVAPRKGPRRRYVRSHRKFLIYAGNECRGFPGTTLGKPILGKECSLVRLRRLMTSQPSLLDNPETALAVLQSLPCAVVDSRGRVIEVNAPFAEKLNR